MRFIVPGMHGQRAADEAIPGITSVRLVTRALAAWRVLHLSPQALPQGLKHEESGSENEWTEDEEEGTALASVEPFAVVADTLRAVQAHSPARFQVRGSAVLHSRACDQRTWLYMSCQELGLFQSSPPDTSPRAAGADERHGCGGASGAAGRHAARRGAAVETAGRVAALAVLLCFVRGFCQVLQ
jgi:hypothetical protein